MRPPLAELFAGGLDVVGAAYQRFKSAFEVCADVTPFLRVDIQLFEYRWDVVRYGAFLVVAKDSAGPVDEFEVIAESER